MSATVAAALKKIAVSLLTNPKVLKTIGGIVLGIIIIIVMPIVAVVSIFNGDINIDTDRLQQMVVQNLSAEEQAKLQFVEDTMYAIEDKMIAAGFEGKVKEAQVLYVLICRNTLEMPLLFPNWWAVLRRIRQMNSSSPLSTLPSAQIWMQMIFQLSWSTSITRLLRLPGLRLEM